MDKTKIEWTDATWNPITGCSKVSAGCAHCYAEGVDRRFAGRWGHEFQPWTTANAEHNVRLHPDRLDQPLRWKRPRKIFVNSVSDLFHEQVPFEFAEKVFTVMEEAHWHIFQILTKRPQRMVEFIRWYEQRSSSDETLGKRWTLPNNIWIGVSCENQQAADERIPLLLQTPAAVRFISCEPLLGPIDLFDFEQFWLGEERTINCESCSTTPGGSPYCPGHDAGGIDWVIVGSESGPYARPMEEAWVQSLRDQCIPAGVAFFYKQKQEDRKIISTPDLEGKTWTEFPQINA